MDGVFFNIYLIKSTIMSEIWELIVIIGTFYPYM